MGKYVRMGESKNLDGVSITVSDTNNKISVADRSYRNGGIVGIIFIIIGIILACFLPSNPESFHFVPIAGMFGIGVIGICGWITNYME